MNGIDGMIYEKEKRERGMIGENRTRHVIGLQSIFPFSLSYS